MINSLKFILSTQLKRSGINKTISGFTLIELLVAMVMAVLIITPLMAFMINILDGDRKEQAKATSEQEIQAALDYIARDLQQAVYIYDADGVTRNTNTTITSSGIADQIPPVKSAPNCNPTTGSSPSVCTPILVFWKRQLKPDSVGISASTQTGANADDGFAYSLVAYYLITNPNQTNSTWSQEARIGRFELQGPVNAANANTTGSASDTGFNPPPINKSGATLKDKMNQWQTASGSYTQRVDTLIDYVSTTAPTSTTTPCSSPNLVGSQTSGFFACVDANEVLAQVYIRGNALARLQNNNLAYADNTKTYFPSSSIRVQGRGFLFSK
ncbi:MAG: prepilin-type N-terminal cleavage/methylation domain-containing protein [Nostoc sp. NMS1]|uniref:hormogonium polysaccharide secretion pseudopilin HpsC n=1 Tax=unclassified Nostoc TaxID=2593658 RepID=UPI0025ECA01E|nr:MULTISPECIES: hormogonium polysaccharide secretion pseudopilin HpsC [unclassified Nostoc]MBN3910033.1 prepilin-type N-terminal cleavage/methylation domain-containing protein [Nostoc sp. NMS1]MBN3992214.1 prepilin-type N-terminal cleavage/methylation domain-containing protein [Nostoc sp. NMS2]